MTQQPPGLVVRLKWSKTHQAPGVPALIPIPSLPGHRTDPLAAFIRMLHVIPTRYPADPLLLLPSRRPVTSRYLQRALRCILTALGFPAHAYSLHSMSCDGATTAVCVGADFLDVKPHGLWQSDAFWEYIANREISDSPVATALCKCYDWHCNPLTRHLPSEVSSMSHDLCIQLNFFKLLFSLFPHNHSFWRPSNFYSGFIPLFCCCKGQFINLSVYY